MTLPGGAVMTVRARQRTLPPRSGFACSKLIPGGVSKCLGQARQPTLFGSIRHKPPFNGSVPWFQRQFGGGRSILGPYRATDHVLLTRNFSRKKDGAS